jgi:hypothetical protein
MRSAIFAARARALRDDALKTQGGGVSDHEI